MNGLLLTVNEALQLAALGPLLFILFFLAVAVRKPRAALLPALYFLSLGCGFLPPLSDLWPALRQDYAQRALAVGDTLDIALAFLLIMQFLLGRVPPAPYWLVLAVPLLGGGALFYGEILLKGESCLFTKYCLPPEAVRMLYHILSSAAIMLLLVAILARAGLRIGEEDRQRAHKYWLVVALILLHLSLLGVYLAALAEAIDPARTLFSATLLRIAFIYLVLTSLFRVFDRQFELDAARVPAVSRYMLSPDDREIARKLTALFEEEHLHREMGLNRARLAERMGVGEHRLSRIINRSFGKSFTALLNGYRIEEAKRRLAGEDTSVTVIAFEVGFNSIASFNRVFREAAGMSPTEFRAARAGTATAAA